MFLMYDLNMNEIEFPEGFIPLDIFISSIDKDRITDKVEGGNRKLNYGSTYNERDIQLSILLKAHDTQDYRLLRDETYALFNRCDTFYLVEKYQQGKRYLVSVDEKFIPDRIPGNQRYADATINCITTELPFAESVGTSADIDNPELIPMVPELWAQGYWSFDTGLGVVSQTNLRTNTDTKIELDVNGEYELFSFGDYEARINIYDINNNLLSYFHSGKNTSRKFSAPNRSNYGRITIRQYKGNENINPNMIGNDIKISLKRTTSGIRYEDELWGYGMGLIYDDDSLIYTHTGTSFKVFNPGIEVHPFEQDLLITISNVVGSTDFLQLENLTTGDVFRVTEAVNDNQLIKLDGPNIMSNNLQYLRKTNRKYITLAPGWNNFRITGATSAKVSFDFRFYY